VILLLGLLLAGRLDNITEKIGIQNGRIAKLETWKRRAR
jgi:hypothetical protein